MSGTPPTPPDIEYQQSMPNQARQLHQALTGLKRKEPVKIESSISRMPFTNALKPSSEEIKAAKKAKKDAEKEKKAAERAAARAAEPAKGYTALRFGPNEISNVQKRTISQITLPNGTPLMGKYGEIRGPLPPTPSPTARPNKPILAVTTPTPVGHLPSMKNSQEASPTPPLSPIISATAASSSSPNNQGTPQLNLNPMGGKHRKHLHRKTRRTRNKKKHRKSRRTHRKRKHRGTRRR